MMDKMQTLSAQYDAEIPPGELYAAKYGPSAFARMTLAGDMNWIAGSMKSAAVLLKKAVRDERAGKDGAAEIKARLLRYVQGEARQWRRYRDRRRQIEKEARLLARDMANGLFKSAAE